MKMCKSCKESIAAEATRCPKCQSFQKWYKNPGVIGIFPMLLILPLLLWQRRGFVDFEEHKTEISVAKISQDTVLVKGEKMLNIIIEVNNQSSVKWEDAIFEVNYHSKSGELLNIEKKKDYNFVVAPNSTAKSSIKVPVYEAYAGAELKVELVDLSDDRY